MATATRKTPARKAAAPAAPKPAAKSPNAPKAAKTVKAAPVARPEKEKKPKMVRDSFTIPKAEYTVLDGLKQRAAGLGRPTRKSEVLRAGIMALAAQGDAAFLASVSAVPTIKTGRPPKD